MSGGDTQVLTCAVQRRRERGFTLIEATMTIAIIGIVSAVVSLIIQRPVQGYFDTARRAELSDVADVALRRMVRDLRLALPNSVRVDATGRYVEFLQVSGGGRYRAQVDSAGGGDVLDFAGPGGDTSFDVIGAMPPAVPGDQIAIFNLGSGFTGADAYQGTSNNRATIASVNGSRVTLTAPKLFPFESPGRRFHVVQYPVTYECDVAAGVVRRYWGYAISPSQATPPSGGSNALLATHVSDCAFAYDPNEILQRYGTVSLRLALSSDQEAVTLFAEAHVPNVP
ncbi:MAG: prepilin-type N-terminal cleavage/methylation domain-containing protein [Betaproteobacteria bacterium]|nr:prepilin-type N-terminal cleavage/methylation domain-containing protein [Betaproteobacteria bacterium]